jgi:hypothetical protein
MALHFNPGTSSTHFRHFDFTPGLVRDGVRIRGQSCLIVVLAYPVGGEFLRRPVAERTVRLLGVAIDPSGFGII